MTYGEIIAVIQCYIHHIKNIQVVINLPRNIGEIRKMQKMFEIANQYFSK
jgi:hypothetical protein